MNTPDQVDGSKELTLVEKNDAHVLVIVTGGTIVTKQRNGVHATENNLMTQVAESSTALHDTEARSVLPTSQQISESIGKTFVLPNQPKSARRVVYCIHEYQVLLESCNMTIDDYKRIAKDIEAYYEMFDGFVILHGTDTMAYTASYLSFMMENLGKPVILTGSQIPIDDSRSDGVDNLVSALLIAGNYAIPEVTLFFHHRLYRGNRAIKIDAQGFHAFESPNMEPLATLGVEIKVDWSLVLRNNPKHPFRAYTDLEQNVGLLLLFPGITATMVRSFLEPPVKGVVLLTYGAGNGSFGSKDLLNAVADAAKRGVLIVNCTQCISGRVNPSNEVTRKLMKDFGILSAKDMTSEAALGKLAYVLGKKKFSREEKLKAFGNNLRGELSKTEANRN